MDNNKKYIYYLNGNVYICKRLRQAQWLVDHNFNFIDRFMSNSGYLNWVFEVSPELEKSLNEYIAEKAISKNIEYKIGDNLLSHHKPYYKY